MLDGGVRENRTKARLAAGEVAIGTLSLLPEPGLAELAGGAGLDFFIIDMEHVAIAGQHVAHMTRAAQSAGTTAIVRVRWAEEKTLLWVLDTGVEGLMVPLVDDAATARRIYELTHYPPDGVRTVCSDTRAASHGTQRTDLRPYLANANNELLLIALLETPEAVENAADIAKEPIDVFCIGRADLSLKMGLGYAPRHPAVDEATKRTLSAVIDAGKTAGVLAYDVDDAEEWIRFGCRFVIYSQPEELLAIEYRNALATLRHEPAPVWKISGERSGASEAQPVAAG